MVPLTIPSTLLSRSPASDSDSGTDDRDATTDRRLEQERNPHLGGRLDQLDPACRDQLLVRRDHGLGVSQRAQHQLSTRFETTHQLDHELDRRVVNQILGTVHQQCGWNSGGARLLDVAHRHPPQLEVDTGLGGDRLAVVEQFARQSTTDVSSPENPDTDTHRSKTVDGQSKTADGRRKTKSTVSAGDVEDCVGVGGVEIAQQGTGFGCRQDH